jgi:hypothetical protein
MKIRILMLSLIGMIFFNSCSSDSNSSDSNSTNSTSQNLDPNTILPKTIFIETSSGSVTYTFNYIGNKIDFIESSGIDYTTGEISSQIINYTYNGDLISKMTSPLDDLPGGSVSNNFTYNSNNQITQSNNNFFSGINESFIYNSDGTVTKTDDDVNDSQTSTIEFNSEFLRTISYNDNNFTSTTKLYYNNSNSPFRNIVGWSNLSPITLGQEGYSDIFFNDKNLLSIDSSYGEDFNFTYTYNDILFPTVINVKTGTVDGYLSVWRRTINISY